MNKYNVRLDAFEGPLDLLLHLINQAEVDIYDIPMTKITEQYLEYVHAMQDLELDVASEYLVMAATLIAIKSKMLLPKQREELLDENSFFYEEDDPREELMNRLIQYRQFKEAAKELQEKETERSFIHTKGPVNLEAFFPEEERKEVSIQGVTMFDMLAAYQKMMKRIKLKAPLEKTVKSQEYSINQRMDEVMTELIRQNGVMNFSSFFSRHEKGHVVITFLAILELMKSDDIICEQESNFQEIRIHLKKDGLMC